MTIFFLDGNDLKEGKAKADFGETGNPVVTLEMKDPNKFGEVTTEISSKPAPENVLVIWLDFEEGVDSYRAEIMKPRNLNLFLLHMLQIQLIHQMLKFQGSFTLEETKELAGILNAGALPVHLEEVYSTSVGAQFGEQALEQDNICRNYRYFAYIRIHACVLPSARICGSYYIIGLYLPHFARLYAH